MYSTLCSVKLKVGEFVDGLLACFLYLTGLLSVLKHQHQTCLLTVCTVLLCMYLLRYDKYILHQLQEFKKRSE